jgi:hypothetical protein
VTIDQVYVLALVWTIAVVHNHNLHSDHRPSFRFENSLDFDYSHIQSRLQVEVDDYAVDEVDMNLKGEREVQRSCCSSVMIENRLENVAECVVRVTVLKSLYERTEGMGIFSRS